MTSPRQTPVISAGRGTALIITASVCFGTAGPLAKAILDAGLSPQQVASVRICLAAVALLAGVTIVNRRALKIRRSDLPVLIGYGVIGVAVIQLLYFVTVSRLPVGIALLLEYQAPVLVTLWVRFVRRRALPRAVWAGVALAVLGLVLIAQVWAGATLNTVGLIAGMGAAACAAAYYLLGERGVATSDPVGMTTWGLAIGAVIMIVVAPPWSIPRSVITAPADFGPLHTRVWVLLVAIAVIATIVAYTTGLAALRYLPSNVVSVLALAEPVVAITLAWLVLGQAMRPVQLVGGVILLGGGLVVQLASRRSPDRTPATEAAVIPG